MLHLLPHSHMDDIKKEYRRRSFAVACNLLSFVLLIFILGLIPSLVMVYSEKTAAEHRIAGQRVTIAAEDKEVAEAFEASVKRGIAIIHNDSNLGSADIDAMLELETRGITFNTIAIIREDDSERAELSGVASARTDLSAFVRSIQATGKYSLDDVPASTFTKDKDLDFSLVLHKK